MSGQDEGRVALRHTSKVVERITFLLAVIGYAGLTVSGSWAVSGRVPIQLRRATAIIVVAHVLMVWAVRYQWSWAQATRNGYAGLMIFHSALILIVTSAFWRDRQGIRLMQVAFALVTLGAVAAVFQYDEVAEYRVPVIVLAVAGIAGITRGWWWRNFSESRPSA